MRGIHRITLALAATTLMGVSAEPDYSQDQLALLDPTARMMALCSGSGGEAPMRANLSLAAAAL